MTEVKPMDPEHLADLRREVALGNVGTATRDLLAAHDYYRSRCSVMVEDVKHVSVTLPKVEAWLVINGWRTQGADRSGWVTYVAPDGDDVDVWNTREQCPALAVRYIADHLDRAPHDILAEMAAL